MRTMPLNESSSFKGTLLGNRVYGLSLTFIIERFFIFGERCQRLGGFFYFYYVWEKEGFFLLPFPENSFKCSLLGF